MDFTVGIVSRNLVSTSNFEIVGVDTFFEASRLGCRKTIFNATKVTYNTYTCAISGMSREMMKMDGRDNTKCRKSKRRDMMCILESLMKGKRQNCNSASSPN